LAKEKWNQSRRVDARVNLAALDRLVKLTRELGVL
jgi:hypothetical protein